MINNIELIGWAGTIFLAFSGVPQMIKSIIDGHSKGMSHGTLWLWMFGELLYVIYVFFKDFDIIQLSNYIFNISAISIIIYFKYFPKNHEKDI